MLGVIELINICVHVSVPQNTAFWIYSLRKYSNERCREQIWVAPGWNLGGTRFLARALATATRVTAKDYQAASARWASVIVKVERLPRTSEHKTTTRTGAGTSPERRVLVRRSSHAERA